MITNEEARARLIPLPPDGDPGVYGALVAAGSALLVREDTHVVSVIPLTFGRARITIAKAGDFLCYDDSW